MYISINKHQDVVKMNKRRHTNPLHSQLETELLKYPKPVIWLQIYLFIYRLSIQQLKQLSSLSLRINQHWGWFKVQECWIFKKIQRRWKSIHVDSNKWTRQKWMWHEWRGAGGPQRPLNKDVMVNATAERTWWWRRRPAGQKVTAGEHPSFLGQSWRDLRFTQILVSDQTGGKLRGMNAKDNTINGPLWIYKYK